MLARLESHPLAAGKNDFDFICAVRGANSARLLGHSNAKPPVTTGGFAYCSHAMIAENYTVPALQIPRVTGILFLDNYPDM